MGGQRAGIANRLKKGNANAQASLGQLYESG